MIMHIQSNFFSFCLGLNWKTNVKNQSEQGWEKHKIIRPAEKPLLVWDQPTCALSQGFAQTARQVYTSRDLNFPCSRLVTRNVSGFPQTET